MLSLEMNRSENLVKCLGSYSFGHYNNAMKISIANLTKINCDNQENINVKNTWKTMWKGIKIFTSGLMHYKT